MVLQNYAAFALTKGIYKTWLNAAESLNTCLARSLSHLYMGKLFIEPDDTGKRVYQPSMYSSKYFKKLSRFG